MPERDVLPNPWSQSPGLLRPRESKPVTVVATASGDTTVLATADGFKTVIYYYEFCSNGEDIITASLKFGSGSTFGTSYLYQAVPVVKNLIQAELATTEDIKVNLSATGTVAVTLHYVQFRIRRD